MSICESSDLKVWSLSEEASQTLTPKAFWIFIIQITAKLLKKSSNNYGTIKYGP